MVLVNVMVIHSLAKKTLLSWSIFDIRDEYNFYDFFSFSLLAQIPGMSGEECRCVSTEVGASRDKTDKVADLTMQVIPVVELFGRFLKYYVESQTVNSPAPHRPVVICKLLILSLLIMNNE